MELWIEVVPSTKKERALERVAKVRHLIDKVFVPEAPLGYPRAHAIAVAHVIQESLEVPSIASVRTVDVNANALVSLLGAAVLLGIEGVVITRGDPPAFGNTVNDVGTEEAIRIARLDHRLKLLKLGVVVSLAKGYSKISERLLGLDIDFALLSRVWNRDQLKHEVFSEARRKGIKLITYIVVAKGNEKEKVFKLLEGHQRVFEPSEVETFVKELEGLVDGILITSPLDHMAFVEAVERVRRVL